LRTVFRDGVRDNLEYPVEEPVVIDRAHHRKYPRCNDRKNTISDTSVLLPSDNDVTIPMPERLVFRNVLAGIRRRSRCLAIRRLASLLEVFMLPDQGELITADRLAVSRG
jgi:hypothetical protein